MIKTDRLTDHFAFGEFWGSSGPEHTKDLAPQLAEHVLNLAHLAKQLEEVRDAALWMYGTQSSKVAVIITPNGGWRSSEQNTRIGGAPASMHLQGRAADIVVRVDGRTIPTPYVRRLVLGLIERGKVDDGGVGLYDGFVHYDTGRPRRWVG